MMDGWMYLWVSERVIKARVCMYKDVCGSHRSMVPGTFLSIIHIVFVIQGLSVSMPSQIQLKGWTKNPMELAVSTLLVL